MAQEALHWSLYKFPIQWEAAVVHGDEVFGPEVCGSSVGTFAADLKTADLLEGL